MLKIPISFRAYDPVALGEPREDPVLRENERLSIPVEDGSGVILINFNLFHWRGGKEPLVTADVA